MSLNEASEGRYGAKRFWCHTQFQQHKTSLTWKIDDFSKINFSAGEFLASSEFGFDEDNKWSLHLYPNGKTEEKKDFVAVYLQSKLSSTNEEPVKCHISIVDASGDKAEEKKLLTFFCWKKSAGWDEFISRERLFKVVDLLLPNDELTVHCYLAKVRKVEKNWISVPNRPRRSITDNSIENTLNRDLGRLLTNGDQLPDVVFEVEDAKISAHKVILMARSPVFATMFEQEMLEALTNTVAIHDIEVQVFRELLSYMYTNHCTLSTVHIAMQLLAAGDKYDIPSLKTLCAHYLDKHLSEEHVVDIVTCADTFGEEKLRKDCIEFICAKLSNIGTFDADWKMKLRSNPQVVGNVMQLLADNDRSHNNLASSCSIVSESTACHSRIVKEVAHAMWKISGFSLCPLEKLDFLTSEKFHIEDVTKKWYLKVFPNEHEHDNECFVSVYLRTKPSETVHVELEVSIINAEAEKLKTRKLKQLVIHEPLYDAGLGWYNFISREELNNLPNDELVLSYEITVQKVTVPVTKKFAPTDPKTNSLAEDIGRLFTKQEFADFSLEINDTEIKAHKIILMCRSLVFARMFNENSTEKSLKITDTKEDVFRELLRFIYTDECSLKNLEFASDILVAANKYDVPSLKEECLNYLYDHISLEEVCDVAILALSVQETQLYKDCLDYICQELPSLNFLVEPMKRLHSNPELLQDVFERHVA